MPFNLVHDPWIRVLNRETYQLETVSMNDLFKRADQYARLAGESEAQDLAILRWLEAVLLTVYSRVDAQDEKYPWLVDDYHVNKYFDNPTVMEGSLVGTWLDLWQAGKYTPAVNHYLEKWVDKFNLDDPHGLWQVDRNQFADLSGKLITDTEFAKPDSTGTLGILQINREISQSKNSKALFTNRRSDQTNLKIDEAARWFTCYQCFAGVSDKNVVKKITDLKAAKVTDKYGKTVSKAAGIPYSVNPVFLEGDSVWETLMLNLTLFDKDHYNSSWQAVNNHKLPFNQWSPLQDPIWEWASYERLLDQDLDFHPNNLAELYTYPSRIFTINWQNQYPLTIWPSGSLRIDTNDYTFEPMAEWEKGEDKSGNVMHVSYRINQQNWQKRMWSTFGNYVEPKSNRKWTPGVWKWLLLLTPKFKQRNLAIPQTRLRTVTYISDGNASSQMPSGDYTDGLVLRPELLVGAAFDSNDLPKITTALDRINMAIGDPYNDFLETWAQLRSLDPDNKSGKSTITHRQARLYAVVSQLVMKALSKFTLEKLDEQLQTLNQEVYQAICNQIEVDLDRELTPHNWQRELKQGKSKQVVKLNYFSARHSYLHAVQKRLNLIATSEVKSSDNN